MSKVYSDDGKKLLLIQCDGNECNESIKPNPEISNSGWIKRGRLEYGDWLEWHYCPVHSDW